MVAFDFETWLRLHEAEVQLHRERRIAQMQNLTDKNFYDGDPTYNEPGNALSTYEVRDEPQSEPYERSNVTGNEPHIADVGDLGEDGVWDSTEGSPAHRASVRVSGASRRVAYKRDEDEEGESAGVFVRLPEKLARMFPPKEEDKSPPHFTLLYLGPTELARFEELVHVLLKVCAHHDAFEIKLKPGVDWFENDKGQQIAHKTVDEESREAMAALHEDMRAAAEKAGFTVKHYKNENGFLAHATLAYLPDRNYDGPVPEGSFPVDSVELWGFSKDAVLGLGRARAKAAMPMPAALPPGWKLEKTTEGRERRYRIWKPIKTGAEYPFTTAAWMTVETDPIKGVWWVTGVQARVPGGWGAFLYEQAMKDATAAGATLESDSTVSNDATKVWDKYHQRPDVERLPREMMSPPRGHDDKTRPEESLKYRYRLKPKQGDVSLSHPERYYDLPGFEDGQLTQFFPNETAPEAKGMPPEGEQRFEDLDLYAPRGRPSTMSPGTSSDMLDGTLETGDHDLENQTPHGFQEHELGGGKLQSEGEMGASLRMLEGPGYDDSPLGTSPDHVEDWVGRAADLRKRVRVRACQRLQAVGSVTASQ